jgi:hypothetical protein
MEGSEVSMKKQFEAFQPSKEQIAFFYQQTQDLEPFTIPLGSVTMLVEEHTPEGPEPKTYGVTFVVAPETMKFKVRVEGPDLFEVCMIAKEETKLKLNALMNALPKSALIGREKAASPAPHLLH